MRGDWLRNLKKTRVDVSNYETPGKCRRQNFSSEYVADYLLVIMDLKQRHLLKTYSNVSNIPASNRTTDLFRNVSRFHLFATFCYLKRLTRL